MIIISLIGALFSGYLTIGQLINGVCPIGGGCPFLGGYPVCIYGFIMFIILFLTSLISYFKKDDVVDKRVLKFVSLFGVLFSLYFSIKEIFFTSYPANYHWPLLLPTCVYGLVMYALIFVVALHVNGCINLCKKRKK
jgi:hypothetical protein